MRKLLSILLCLPFIGFAQIVPQGINYQAVARDANGDVLMNQALTIQFSVFRPPTPTDPNIVYVGAQYCASKTSTRMVRAFRAF